ncbi:MAG: 50S ribosomal protein L18Ae [Candidatus Diapherotrites archaeon]
MKFHITASSNGKTFSKTVEAESQKRALEKMYSDVGSEQHFLRRKIIVEKVEEVNKNA